MKSVFSSFRAELTRGSLELFPQVVSSAHKACHKLAKVAKGLLKPVFGSNINIHNDEEWKILILFHMLHLLRSSRNILLRWEYFKA